MIAYFRAGSSIPLTLKIYDGNSSQYPSAFVRTKAGAFETVNLLHLTSGFYVSVSSQIPQTPYVVVQYRVFSDALKTTYSTEYGGAVELFINNDLAVPVACQIDSMDETKFVRAKVYRKDGTLLQTLSVPHVSAGLYLTDTTMPAGESFVVVVLDVFDDAGFTQPSTEHGSTQYVYGYNLLAAIDVRDGLIGGI